MKNSMLVLVLAVALIGCITHKQAASSRAVLGPGRSSLVIARPLDATALELVRQFTQRGFALTWHTRTASGLVLRFKGARGQFEQAPDPELVALRSLTRTLETYDAVKHGRPVHDHDHHDVHERETTWIDLGSVFYVRLTPQGAATAIDAMGRPTRNGVEGCTTDPDIAAPCVDLYVGKLDYHRIDGGAEAEVIEGVFSELRLQGGVLSPDPALADAAGARAAAIEDCRERRRNMAALWARVSDPRARAQIARSAPKCDG